MAASAPVGGPAPVDPQAAPLLAGRRSHYWRKGWSHAHGGTHPQTVPCSWRATRNEREGNPEGNGGGRVRASLTVNWPAAGGPSAGPRHRRRRAPGAPAAHRAAGHGYSAAGGRGAALRSGRLARSLLTPGRPRVRRLLRLRRGSGRTSLGACVGSWLHSVLSSIDLYAGSTDLSSRYGAHLGGRSHRSRAIEVMRNATA